MPFYSEYANSIITIEEGVTTITDGVLVCNQIYCDSFVTNGLQLNSYSLSDGTITIQDGNISYANQVTTNNISSTNLSASNAHIETLNAINISSTNLSVINISVTNASFEVAYVTEFNSENLSAINASFTNANITTLNLNSLSIPGNLSVNNLSTNNGSFTTANITTANITTLKLDSLSLTGNLSTNNVSANNASFKNAYIESLNAANVVYSNVFDSFTATTLEIGNNNATEINIGQSGINTNISGTFSVNGASLISGVHFESTQSNSSYGYNALESLTSGTNNMAVGYRSLNAVISGVDNTAVGHNSMLYSTGSSNTIVGSSGMNAINNTGTNNVGIGYQVLSGATGGGSNVAIGYQSLKNITTGTGNIGIGTLAGPTSSMDYTVGIGNNVAPTKSNQIVLGNSTNYSELDLIVSGCVGINTTSPNILYKLDVNGITNTSTLFTSQIDSQSETPLYIGNTSATMINIGKSSTTINTSNLSVSNLTATTINVNILSANNISATNASFETTNITTANVTTLKVAGNISTNNLSANNMSATTGYIGSSLKVGGADIFNFSSVGYSTQYRKSSVATDGILDLFSDFGSTKNNVFGITANGNVTSDGNVTAGSFNITSDYRIKDNVCSIINTSYDSLFSNLNPVYYHNKKSNMNEFGFIAHEVDEIFPELVKGLKDDETILQNINYIGIIPLCVSEIKKLKSIVTMLIKKIETLEKMT